MGVSVLSFFTGGGFFDLGFTQAGFDVKWTNEYNPSFIVGYEYGMTSWLTTKRGKNHSAQISNTASICELVSHRVLREAFGVSRPELFGVIGGPPCPDFSSGGVHAGGNGANGQLTSVFVDMLCSLRPTFFVLENVAGLYRFHKHRIFLEEKIAQLRTSGYVVDYRVLNALELGVPQDRERLFVVGITKSVANAILRRTLANNETGWFPWPSVTKYLGAKSLAWPRRSPFGDEPPIPPNVPLELTVYSAFSLLGDPEAIPNGNESFVPHSAKFVEVAEGDVSRKSFKRLHRYRFSPTAWYGNQEVHLHPWKPRRISVREAMRLQTIPDSYVLPTELSLSSKFKLICNGVPCVMAFKLGKALKRLLEPLER